MHLHPLPVHGADADLMIDPAHLDGHRVGRPRDPEFGGGLDGLAIPGNGDVNVDTALGQSDREGTDHVGQAAGLDEGVHLTGDMQDA